MEVPWAVLGDWLGTATVTAQGSPSRPTRRTRDGDFYLTTSGDLDPATNGDFFMARDRLAAGSVTLPIDRRALTRSLSCV